MKTQVLIIGAGPVGMTVASELARYGISVRIVDKAPHRTDKSKALVVWSRTLELLDRGPSGAAPFVAAGFKANAVNLVAGSGELMGHVTMDAVKSPYPFGLMLPQSETERLLEERLAGLGVTVERQTEVLDFTTSDSGVEATLRCADGQEKTVAAEWLLGCDGAHSVVRHRLGVPFSGETMDSDWVLADLHMSGYAFPDSEVSVYWHKDGVFVIFPISPGRYRVVADLPSTGGDNYTRAFSGTSPDDHRSSRSWRAEGLRSDLDRWLQNQWPEGERVSQRTRFSARRRCTRPQSCGRAGYEYWHAGCV